jgi:putative Mg2+ transporter-C (MgtC) family protein
MAIFGFTGEADFVIKLIISVLFGVVLGYARRGHPVRMRTLALVAMGSTIFTIISLAQFNSSVVDPTRVMAQIVTGIGFLGAGVIWRGHTSMGGLTTAAAIWTIAGLGMLIGMEMWITAFAGLLLSFFILTSKEAEKKIIGDEKHVRPGF